MTVIATLKVKAGSETAFQQAADKMIAHVKANEPGTLMYILNRSNSDPSKFVFYEVYQDQGAFAAHGGSEPMQQFFGAVGLLLDGRPEIHMYEELGGKK
ncbi:MAG TPA: putative quinol monooxygenase [Candidatus Kryptonia bacterium]|nr:putative quinol monooxygenase [Candidatus Kryptonia bacterium]